MQKANEQAREQASTRTSEQAGEQASKQAAERASRRASKQASERASEQACERNREEASACASNQPSNRVNNKEANKGATQMCYQILGHGYTPPPLHAGGSPSTVQNLGNRLHKVGASCCYFQLGIHVKSCTGRDKERGGMGTASYCGSHPKKKTKKNFLRRIAVCTAVLRGENCCTYSSSSPQRTVTHIAVPRIAICEKLL